MKESKSSLPAIAVDSIIDRRFKITRPLPELGEGVYLAVETATNSERLALAIDESEKSSMLALHDVSHAHLASVHDVVEVEGGAVAITERVPGETLTAMLDKIGKKEPVDAVRSALRVADALSVAHRANAHHGRLHPNVIVVHPEGRTAPVVGFGGPTDDDSVYRSPDRGGEGPSEHDDAWGVAALLLKMLTGTDPPSDGFESEEEIEKHGVSDPTLRASLLAALHTNPTERSEGLRPLKRDLARWFVDHAGEEPLVHAPMSSSPPPLPIDSQAPVTARPQARDTKPAPRTNRLPILAAGGLVFGLGAAWAASSLLGEPAAPPPAQAPAPAPSASAADDEIDLGEVDIEGESDTDNVANKLSACVASYLPKKSFDKAPDLSWVCSVDNPRQGADKLRAAVVSNAPERQVSTAMKLFSRMGWYDMLPFSVVRAGCCPDAAALKLPDPSEGCERLDGLATTIGRQVVDGQDFEATLDQFTKATKCEVKAGQAARFKKSGGPEGGEREAFLEYTSELE